jgi:hypothetical protein
MQVSCWDPRVFIIGGVSKAGELLVGQARATFQARLTARSHRPTATVRPGGRAGQDAGLIGAAKRPGGNPSHTPPRRRSSLRPMVSQALQPSSLWDLYSATPMSADQFRRTK